MTSRRGLLPREAARVDACRKTLTLLACIRLPFERRQFAISKVAYGWIARAPPLTLCKRLWSLIHVGSGRIRAASPWLRAAVFGGGMHLDVLFASQLVGIFSRLQRSRDLVWLDSAGSPAHAFNSWLLSHGWTRTAEWKWNHGDTGLRLDLTTQGDAGQRQHVVRDAWRAWCLRRHMASDRRDTQLDCFDGVGYLLRRARLLVRWFAVLRFPQLLSVVGSLLTLPPLAFGTTAPNLARLIMLLGNVSIVLVLSLNLPSFFLLGMVGL